MAIARSGESALSSSSESQTAAVPKTMNRLR
jgi:hypothetical protein